MKRPRAVRHVGDGDFGLIAFDRDAAHDDVLQSWRFFFHNGSSVVLKLLRTSKGTLNFLANSTERDCMTFEPEAGHFEKFIIGDHVNFPGRGNDARIAGINAIDVSVDLAIVGFESGGDGDGGEVASSASKRGDLAL